MVDVTLSAEANDDLDNIYIETFELLGAAQAETYLARFERAFRQLGEHPKSGQSADLVSNGLRRLVLGRHVVFHRDLGNRVRIVRILHQNMDPYRHLG